MSMGIIEALRLSLTAPSTSADHQALGWRLMRSKGMENEATFSAREVKRAATEKETSIPLQKDSESQSRRQSHPSELSESWRKEDARWGERLGREGQIEEMVGGQNPGPEAPPRNKKEQERREQRKCHERSDCQRSDVEGWVCQGH